VGVHVQFGEFSRALELLQKQLGIRDFAKFKQQFIDIHTLSNLRLQNKDQHQVYEFRDAFAKAPVQVLTQNSIN